MKRNNVSLDIINFSNPENVPKLEALIKTCNNSNNSHFMDVPMGIGMITDVLFNSPILHGDDVGGNAGGNNMPAQGNPGG